MSLLLPLLPRRLPPSKLTTLALGLTSSSYLLHRQRAPILCESASSPLDTLTQKYLPSSSSSSSSSTRTTTKTRNSKARIIRQLSLGSVLGVAAGVAVSTFSRALGLLLGLGVAVVQSQQEKGEEEKE
ncbi:MAG: hypothetical protein LQ344_001543 [Seirophora lacunosa]|nr:MAG: hypothetical protein LQ344_001543 [Seirophora lacunosa]